MVLLILNSRKFKQIYREEKQVNASIGQCRGKVSERQENGLQKDMRRIVGVMYSFIIFTVVTITLEYMSTLLNLYTLKLYNLLYVNYTPSKVVKK